MNLKGLVDVVRQIRLLEKQIDDILWEEGPTDPRLVQLSDELQALRRADARGETHYPNF